MSNINNQQLSSFVNSKVPSGRQKGQKHQTGSTSRESNDSKDNFTNFWSDDQLMRRAIKDDTPPSSKPDKYQCRRCGKCYAEDRKEEFEFHRKENNCGPGKNTKTDKMDSMESKQGKYNGSNSIYGLNYSITTMIILFSN